MVFKILEIAYGPLSHRDGTTYSWYKYIVPETFEKKPTTKVSNNKKFEFYFRSTRQNCFAKHEVYYYGFKIHSTLKDIWRKWFSCIHFRTTPENEPQYISLACLDASEGDQNLPPCLVSILVATSLALDLPSRIRKNLFWIFIADDRGQSSALVHRRLIIIFIFIISKDVTRIEKLEFFLRRTLIISSSFTRHVATSLTF